MFEKFASIAILRNASTHTFMKSRAIPQGPPTERYSDLLTLMPRMVAH